MRSSTAPSSLPATNRNVPYETMTWVVAATLTKYKLEDDSDYHMVITDHDGNTMITEAAAPFCLGTGDPLALLIMQARNQFDNHFSATTSFQTVSVPVRITGVGFFDFLHGQTGVSQHGIELHPF